MTGDLSLSLFLLPPQILKQLFGPNHHPSSELARTDFHLLNIKPFSDHHELNFL